MLAQTSEKMRMLSVTATSGLALCCALSAPLAPLLAGSEGVDPKPSRHELKAIEKRGKLIVELDRFAAKSTDVMYTQGLGMPESGLYICTKEKTGLQCTFGTPHIESKVFTVAFIVREDRTEGDVDLFQFQVPKDERGWLAQAAAAILKAGSVFPFNDGAEAYNHIVVPERDNTISVYFIPATSRHDVRVMGADGVVRITPAGDTDIHRYHQALLTFDVPPDAGELTGGAHTHTLLSAPNPLDVYYAMTASGGAEYVLGANWAFEVDNTGAIQSLGNTAAFIEKLEEIASDESTQE